MSIVASTGLSYQYRIADAGLLASVGRPYGIPPY